MKDLCIDTREWPEMWTLDILFDYLEEEYFKAGYKDFPEKLIVTPTQAAWLKAEYMSTRGQLRLEHVRVNLKSDREFPIVVHTQLKDMKLEIIKK